MLPAVLYQLLTESKRPIYAKPVVIYIPGSNFGLSSLILTITAHIPGIYRITLEIAHTPGWMISEPTSPQPGGAYTTKGVGLRRSRQDIFP